MSLAFRPVTPALSLRVPWVTVLGCVLVAGGFALLSGIAPGAAQSPLTLRLAQLALAASAAYVLDDAGAVMTRVVPRPLWLRRLLPVALGIGAVSTAWLAIVIALPPLTAPTLRALTTEVVVLVLLALAASSVLAAREEPEPGNLVAVSLPVAGLGALVLGGMLGLDVYLSSHVPVHAALTTAWIAGGTCCAAVLARTTRAGSAQSVVAWFITTMRNSSADVTRRTSLRVETEAQLVHRLEPEVLLATVLVGVGPRTCASPRRRSNGRARAGTAPASCGPSPARVRSVRRPRAGRAPRQRRSGWPRHRGRCSPARRPTRPASAVPKNAVNRVQVSITPPQRG